jgi:ABC-2 type transport system ATP-binding protein
MITVKNLFKEYKVPKGENSVKGSIRHFFKSEYEIRQALKNLSFHISQGVIVGFIGPNGAGKSTAIKILTGIVSPSNGIVRVDGMDPYMNRNENLKQIGCVLGHKTQLWQGMPVIDSYEMVKHMYKIPYKQYNENLQLFRSILDLESILYSHPENLSLGQRVKADFACAMMHDPKIIYLDEPTIGLDIIAKEKILDFIYEVNRLKKTTILFTTHNLTDIEKICSRIMILDKGHLIYNGYLKRMKEIYASEHLMHLKIDKMKVPDLQDIPIKKYQIENENISITYDSRIINSSVILSHIVKQCHVDSINIKEPKLNDIIRTIYERL